MIPNLNKVKLPFLEREKFAIPEIEFRYVFVLIHRPGAWTLDRSRLPLTPNPFYLKNGILVDGFEQWKINFFSENSDWENRISSVLPRENDYLLIL